MAQERKSDGWGLKVVNVIGVTVCVGGYLATMAWLVAHATKPIQWPAVWLPFPTLGLAAASCFESLRQKRPIVSFVGTSASLLLLAAFSAYALYMGTGASTWILWVGLVVGAVGFLVRAASFVGLFPPIGRKAAP
jgi:hypothetical protein